MNQKNNKTDNQKDLELADFNTRLRIENQKLKKHSKYFRWCPRPYSGWCPS